MTAKTRSSAPPPKTQDRKAQDGAAPRAWQRMLSGRRLDLLHPSPLDIEVEDIAQGLSRVARWNGQTRGDWAFSVAQHSLLVERLVARLRPAFARRWLLAALLHDAAEYVLGDLITPVKGAVGSDYKQLELRLGEAVHIRFGLPAQLPSQVQTVIKSADRAAAYFEATQLAGFDETEALSFFGQPGSLATPTLTPLPPDEAKRLFVARYQALSEAEA
ncbi:MAG: HD domain-containing protein [Rhodospirillales bacterium]